MLRKSRAKALIKLTYQIYKYSNMYHTICKFKYLEYVLMC